MRTLILFLSVLCLTACQERDGEPHSAAVTLPVDAPAPDAAQASSVVEVKSTMVAVGRDGKVTKTTKKVETKTTKKGKVHHDPEAPAGAVEFKKTK